METFCIDEDAPRRISTHGNSFPALATPPVLNVNSLDTCASPGHQPTTTVFGSEPLCSPRALGTVHSAPDAPLQLPKTSTSSSRVSDDSEGETSPKHTSSHYHNNNPEPSSSKTTSDSHEYMQQTNSSVRHTDRSANEKHKPNGKHSNSRENVHLNLQDRGRRKHMTKSSSLSKEESQSGSRDLDKRSHSANSTNVNGSEKRDMNGQKPADRHRQHCKHNRSAESRRNSSSSVSNSVTSSRSNVNSHCDKCSLGDVTSPSSSSNHAAHASSRGENRDRRGRRSNSRQSSRDSSKEDVQKLACVEVDDENRSPSPQGNVNIGFVNSNDETTPTALQQQYVGF